MIAANQTPESQHRTPISLYRNRVYSAQLGRFITRVPIGHEGSEWNLYEYVGGRATNLSDPMGLAMGNWPLAGCQRKIPSLPPSKTPPLIIFPFVIPRPNLVDTGLQFCDGRLHGFILLTDGVGYGFYAESHLAGGATKCDDLKTLTIVPGQV